jgi:hypothetical protein
MKHVKSGYHSSSRSGFGYADQHFHGSGFSGSIGTQKTENFSLFYFKRNGINGCKITKFLGEVFYNNGFVGGHILFFLNQLNYIVHFQTH